MKKTGPCKKWTQEEVNFINTHSIDDSVNQLKRTKSSIKTKLFRIGKIN
jgi:hypothetical protein